VTLPQTGERSGGRSILIFHRVVPGPLERDHDLMWSDFLLLLDRLQAAGCTFARDLEAEPNDGAVVLTFDDTSSDHMAVAEALAARSIPAVFFAPAGHLGTPGHLDPATLRELVAGGHIIGSHGWSHKRLDRISKQDLTTEIESSRAKLEDLAGVPVTVFAPAGGIGFRSLPERLAAAGYVASRSARWGIHRRASDRWRIPAVPVTHVTFDRGWVVGAATNQRLPVVMNVLGAVRSVLSPDTRTSLRRRLYALRGVAERGDTET
jgi:peptidoglycan/xylan/chitin deacetylase (PgdA/CDA1 family)